MKEYREGIILSNEEISKDIFLMRLDFKCECSPGQFFMVRAWNKDPILSRPLSICDYEDGILTFLYERVGKGTALLSNMKEGAKLTLLGPLGNSYAVPKNKRTALIGGGVGIAPLYYIAKKAVTAPDLFVGFRDEVYLADHMESYIANSYVATETGQFGQKGFVTELIDFEKYDECFICGPTGMLQAILQKNPSCEVYASLESHMACGFGACLGCALKTVHGTKHVCKDGPIFKGKEILL